MKRLDDGTVDKYLPTGSIGRIRCKNCIMRLQSCKKENSINVTHLQVIFQFINIITDAAEVLFPL
jgi:hypothetical protein